MREIPVRGKQGIVITTIEWSPNGSWLAFAGRQPDIWSEPMMRAGPRSSVLDNERRLATDDGSAEYPVGAVDASIDGRLSMTIGLGVAAAIAVLLGLRRLVRRYRPAR